MSDGVKGFIAEAGRQAVPYIPSKQGTPALSLYPLLCTIKGTY